MSPMELSFMTFKFEHDVASICVLNNVVRLTTINGKYKCIMYILGISSSICYVAILGCKPFDEHGNYILDSSNCELEFDSLHEH